MLNLQGISKVRPTSSTAVPFIIEGTKPASNAEWEKGKDIFRCLGQLDKNVDVAGHAILKELLMREIYETACGYRGVPYNEFNLQRDAKFVLSSGNELGLPNDEAALCNEFGLVFFFGRRSNITLEDYAALVLDRMDKPDARGKTDGFVTFEEFGETMAAYEGRHKNLFLSLGFRDRSLGKVSVPLSVTVANGQ